MLKDNIFKLYPNKVFVETGSYLGNGIQNAIDAKFEKIYSIELSDKYYNYCKDKFKFISHVNIIQGDSYDKLAEVIKDIDEPITFWLDGHHSCGDTALGKYWTPLMYELEQIKNHHIKNHTIIIDDMSCWQEPNPVHGFYVKDIFEKLDTFSTKYEYWYIDNQCKNDILVIKFEK